MAAIIDRVPEPGLRGAMHDRRFPGRERQGGRPHPDRLPAAAAEASSPVPVRGLDSRCRLFGAPGSSVWQRLRSLATAALAWRSPAAATLGSPRPTDGWGLPALLAVVALLVSLGVTAPVHAAFSVSSAAPSQPFRCDGLPLTATLHGGAVDDPAIPNSSAGTLPGAFVQLKWQQAGEAITLQLPRTNNAGPPSFTDGKWWWSLEDPNHPRFRLRQGRGEIQDFACEPA